jgi:pyruvate/2-oxoglutarate dehydrogenase complex dihydrolipoamide acyltransferase (E2) component
MLQVDFIFPRWKSMTDINVDEALWATSMLPEGFVVRWLVDDGTLVSTGERIAEIRIEDALHEITAPASGKISIVAPRNAVIEPGALLATLASSEPASRG